MGGVDLHRRHDRRVLHRHATPATFPPTISGLLVLWMMVGFGVVGFIDDYMKVRQPAQPRPDRDGARSSARSSWSCRSAVVSLNFPNAAGQTPASPYVSVFRDVPVLSFMALGPIVGWILYISWVTLHRRRVVQQHQCHRRPRRPRGRRRASSVAAHQPHHVLAVPAALRLRGARPPTSRPRATAPATRSTSTIVAAAFVGALGGFLWWNAPKAQVFMGDVGLDGDRRRHRRHVDPLPHRGAGRHRRRRLHHRSRLGDPAAAGTSSSRGASGCS